MLAKVFHGVTMHPSHRQNSRIISCSLHYPEAARLHGMDLAAAGGSIDGAVARMAVWNSVMGMSQATLKGCRILVVDDEAPIVSVLSKVL